MLHLVSGFWHLIICLVEVRMRVRALVGKHCEIVGPEASIRDVAVAMKNVGVSAVAVVDRTGLVGICTDRDLAMAVADGCDSSVAVHDVMALSPDTIDAEAPVRDAALWLLETGYRHLPVLENDELLGIIDSRDVLWAMTPKE
jgi:signal-transduction protein with cAMP-binding, CBS, and nucleotidyltransferase domain